MSGLELAVVHPLVLLSVVDHFNRTNLKRKQKKRVIGTLLGEVNGGRVEVSNCYGLPFEQDEKENNVWFADHLYHERMFKMFKKINPKEKVVGWYTTGTRFQPHDIHINEIFRRYSSRHVFLVVDVENNDPMGLPTEGYVTKEEVSKDGEIIRSFHHIETTVQAYEPEEIGVEHLLRELKDLSVDSLAEHITEKKRSIDTLAAKLKAIAEYLQQLVDKKLEVNSQLLFLLQNILNLLPDLAAPETTEAFTVKTNDQMYTLFMGMATQSILSLHSVVQAERVHQEQERAKEREREQEQEQKDKELKEKELKEKELKDK